MIFILFFGKISKNFFIRSVYFGVSLDKACQLPDWHISVTTIYRTRVANHFVKYRFVPYLKNKSSFFYIQLATLVTFSVTVQ